MKILVYVSVAIAAAGIVTILTDRFSNPGRCKQTTPRATCISNLRQIDAAKEQWALENKKTDGDPIVKAEVLQYVKGGKVTCPANGIYAFGKVGKTPTCTIEGHTIQ